MSVDEASNENIEKLLSAIDNGDEHAMSELIAAIYPELKRLAHFQMAGERSEHTLNTTAIVHEAYMRLAARNKGWKDRKHFLRAAAAVMRHLLVDHARKRNAAKRDDGKAALPFDDNRLVTDDDTVAVLALDYAMKEIVAIDPRLEHIIDVSLLRGIECRGHGRSARHGRSHC